MDFIGNENQWTESVMEISEITTAVSTTSDFPDFMKLIERHEIILSEVLQKSTVKQDLFFDFDGVIKSLGAWGGDFVMVASFLPEKEIRAYFALRGFKTILNYSKMVEKDDIS